MTLAAASVMLSAPLAARSPTDEQIDVINAVDDFFNALRSDDKAALATEMMPEATIFIHNRLDPSKPRIDVVPVADHLARWAKSSAEVNELMSYDTILVDGDMAQVWGPYAFWAEGELSHCGVNSLSLAKGERGWKVANTSFTMEPPETCGDIAARLATEWESSE
ncbi:hypothetical protein ACI5KX_04435 [Erythrobacter sp. GH1-10]|uniref:hypothetical protein n=1 Tax=Erythrobacter sp. GH1-10 TaxID=3349334 RepID=UPI003877C72F